MTASSTSRHDVIVVGAGLAGLQCAAHLVGAGSDVVVLEARDRVGGRVHSHRFSDGQWCELGGEFVDDAHRHVLDLVERFGLTLCPVPSGRDDMARMVDLGGRPAPYAFYGSLAEELARWDAVLADLAAAVDLDDVPSSADAARLDAAPLSELLDGLGLSIVARVVIGRDIRSEYMLGPDEVSMLMAAWMTALHLRSGDGVEGWRIVGGNDQLAARLAAPLQERVRLGAAVAWLDADAGEVVLRSGERLEADHLVVTAPLPTLGRLWPTMPAELAAVSYGIGGKVCVQVGRRIWRDQGRDASVRSDRAVGELWEATDGQGGDAGVLTALLSSHDGAVLGSMPDGEQRVLAEIDRIFPGVRGLAGERVRTDWTNDPHSLGAFATFGPGQLLRAWSTLRRRHGRVVLAGEHTDSWAGYMEGALRSGARAATTVVATT
jgi:monoamine oxidase